MWTVEKGSETSREQCTYCARKKFGNSHALLTPDKRSITP